MQKQKDSYPIITSQKLSSDQLDVLTSDSEIIQESLKKVTTEPSPPNRFLMVIIFGLANFFIGFMGSPVAPFASTAKRVYGVSLDQITLSSSVFSFAGLVTGFSANYVIHKFGMRNATILSSFLALGGMVLKMGINDVSFFSVHLGEVLAGLGAPFIQNGIAHFANHWFQGKSVISIFFFLFFFFF